MPKVRQLVLTLESKPGVLSKLARVLADAGVNIIALCAPETATRGKLRMVVSDPDRAMEALKTAKYRVSEEAALTVVLQNQPGSLAGVAEKLGRARVNVKCAYAASEGEKSFAVLSVANVDKARQALGE
jgi:hypothetical protein